MTERMEDTALKDLYYIRKRPEVFQSGRANSWPGRLRRIQRARGGEENRGEESDGVVESGVFLGWSVISGDGGVWYHSRVTSLRGETARALRRDDR